MAKLKTKTNEPALPEEPKYITLAREAEAEFEEKRSRFIGRAAPVKTEAEAEDLIRRVKADYPGATHYVWAYTMRGGAQARSTRKNAATTDAPDGSRKRRPCNGSDTPPRARSPLFAQRTCNTALYEQIIAVFSFEFSSKTGLLYADLTV